MSTPQKMNKHDPIKRHLKISLRLDVNNAIDLFLRNSIQIIVTSLILIQHNPYKNQASFAQVIDPIYSHTSYFGKSIGLNKRTVPTNRTVSSKWHQRVHISQLNCHFDFSSCWLVHSLPLHGCDGWEDGRDRCGAGMTTNYSYFSLLSKISLKNEIINLPGAQINEIVLIGLCRSLRVP